MKKKIALILVLVLLLAGAGVFALYHQQILSFLFPVRNDWVEQDGGMSVIEIDDWQANLDILKAIIEGK